MLALLTAALLSADARPVISVLYFDNNSKNGDLDVMRKGLADMIVTDLVAWDGVTVVERDRLEAVLGELKLQASRKFDPGTAVKVGKLIGAQYALTGSMNLAADELRLDAVLVSVQTGATSASASTRGDKNKIFDLEQELVTRITAAIDQKLKDPTARKKARAPDMEALIAYSKALDLSDQGKLDEAQAAMQALVSKSPTFLMARERKQQLLDKLKDYEKKKKELTTDSVLQVGKLTRQALGADFDSLDEKAQRRYLSMRNLEGRFMLRAGKQFFSWRRESLRLPLKGKEAQALGVLHAWAENQKKLVAERARYFAAHGPHPSTNDELEPEMKDLMRDADFGEVELSHDPTWALVDFVLFGRATDGARGRSFTFAPALGDLDPEWQKAAFALLDQQLDAALARPDKKLAENEATRLLDTKAEALLRLDREEEAIGAWQKILDQFPTSSQASRTEDRIKVLLGAKHDNSRDKQERWAKALAGCDDMDIRVGMDSVDRLVYRMGLAAHGVYAAQLEKACKPTPRNRSAFAQMYRDFALDSAWHEDCDAFRAWFKKYVEFDGSIGDMMAYQKNHTPWCELGEVTKSVLWMTAKMDRDWEFEHTKMLRSVLGGKQLRIMSSDDKYRAITKSDDSITFTLDVAQSYACTEVRWQRQGASLKGTCDVKMTKVAEQKGEFDEGTFTASFIDDDGPFKRKIELTDGKFRVRRQ